MNMKKRLRRLATLLLALMMLAPLVACGGTPAPSSSAPAPSDSAPAPSGDSGGSGGSDEVYEISVNTFLPELIAPGKATRSAIDFIEKASNGRIKIKDYWDGTYVSFAETIQAVATGTIDIGFIDPTHLSESFNANQIISMYIEADVPSRQLQSEALQQAVRDIPELQQEFSDIGVMWIGIVSSGSGIIHFAGDVDVRKPDDLKGMSMEALAAGNELIKECGAAMIGSPVTEWYTGLERNVIDALIHNWGAVDGFRFNEVTSTHLYFTTEEHSDEDARGLYISAMGWIMNKAKFESLPKDIQDLILDAFGREYSDRFIEFEMPACLSGYNEAVSMGHKFIYLEPAEVAVWRDKVASSNKTVLDRIQANGFDSYDIYRRWNEIIQAKFDSEQ